jgi:single-strand DNA-binding protein
MENSKMAGYLNKVMLIGNLGRDPELSKTNGGNSVASFSIATTERYTDKQGQRQENTEWHNIVAWGKQAEVVAQYLQKGSSVLIEGKLTTRSWENDGKTNYKTEIVMSNFSFLDKLEQGNQQGQPQAQQGGGFGGQPQQQSQQSSGFGGAPQQQSQAPAGLPVEDELPF